MLRSQLGFILIFISFLSQAQVENGFVDLRPYDFVNETSSLKLNGFWFYQPDVLAESELDPNATQQIKVPATWNANGLSSHGYGTYQITIVKSY